MVIEGKSVALRVISSDGVRQNRTPGSLQYLGLAARIVLGGFAIAAPQKATNEVGPKKYHDSVNRPLAKKIEQPIIFRSKKVLVGPARLSKAQHQHHQPGAHPAQGDPKQAREDSMKPLSHFSSGLFL